MALQFWKLRRELARLGQQCLSLPTTLVCYFFGTPFYDRNLAPEMSSYSGHLPASKKVAIFVIYPLGGLQPSCLRTLEYFHRKGYAVIVVSNLSLSESEREQVLCNCWRYVERPNYGYDFGAYRDGILSLVGIITQLERLVLINDSTWFPIPGSTDWLDAVDALNVDFAGAASHFGISLRKDPDKIIWEHSAWNRRFHYGSFALCIQSKILMDPEFITFWKEFRLSNSKRQTVERGEIGLTRWVLKQGYSHGATLDTKNLDHYLMGLSAEKLLEIARTLIVPDLPALYEKIDGVISEIPPQRKKLIDLILLAVARQGAAYAIAPYAILACGFQFLKKSPVFVGGRGAKITNELLSSIIGGQYILSEIQDCGKKCE